MPTRYGSRRRIGNSRRLGATPKRHHAGSSVLQPEIRVKVHDALAAEAEQAVVSDLTFQKEGLFEAPAADGALLPIPGRLTGCLAAEHPEPRDGKRAEDNEKCSREYGYGHAEGMRLLSLDADRNAVPQGEDGRKEIS